jgi:glycosyltransferase 2 family protein
MWKRLFTVLSITLGIAGFCAIPFIVGLEDLLRTIAEVGWVCVMVFTANAACSLLIPAVGWWMLMRAEGIPASLSTAVLANLMGFPINVLTPSMYLGGEPLKVLYVASVCKVAKQRVLATVIAAKFQEFGGLILGMLVATALFVWHTDFFTRRNEALLIAINGVLAVLLGLGFYSFAGHLRPLVKILAVAARFRRFEGRAKRLQILAEEVENCIHTTVTKRLRLFILAQAVTCLSAVSIFLRPWIFFRFLPTFELGFNQLCVLFVLTNLVNGLPLIPGALGLFEAAMTGYASAAGLGDEKGAAFAVITRIADLLLFMLGSWLIVHYGLTQSVRIHDPDLGTEATPDS